MKKEINQLLNPALGSIAAYRVEGGQQADIKLNQNESPFDVPMWLKEEIATAFLREPWNRYPDILPYRGMQAYAEFLGIRPERVMMGNGSNELLYTIFMACLAPGRSVLIPEPSFSLYEKLALLFQADIVRVPMGPALDFDTEAILRAIRDRDPDFIVLSTPNNPTSKSLSLEEVRSIAAATASIVLVDEAYIEFSRQESAIQLIDEHPNVVVLRTMSKALALAGMRIGFAIAEASLMEELAKPKIPFASNRLAEITLMGVLRNYSLVEDAVGYILAERDRLYGELLDIPALEVFRSDTNFLIIRVPDAGVVFGSLAGAGILVRNVSGYPQMENCLRFNIGLVEENGKLAAELAAL